MKKILLSAAFVAALTLGSCAGKDASSTIGNASDFKAKIENCTNPDSIQAYVAEAKAYVQKLVDDGKVEEAKKYLDQIEPVVQQKAPKLAGAFEAVKSLVDKVPGAAADAIDKAKEAASEAGDSLSSTAENVKDAAAETIEDVKNAVSDKVSDAKDAVTQKASDAANAVSEKATDIKDAAKEKVNDLLKK